MGGSGRRALAQAVRDERHRRRLNQAGFARAVGLHGPRTIGHIEQADEHNYSDETKACIEDALGWQRGSFDLVVEGRAPRPVTDPAFQRVRLAWPDLSQRERETLANLADDMLRREL